MSPARRREAPLYVPTSRPPDGDDVALDNIVGIAALAYNHPLDDLLPRKEGEPLSHGELMRRALVASFARDPTFAAKFRRMLDVRTRRYGHLATPVTDCRATWQKNRTVDIVIKLARLDDDEAEGEEPGES